MAINKLIPRKLNKDSDRKLLLGTEAYDMLNVRVQHDDDGNEGVIKNAFGNRAVQAVLPSGTNVCVGAFTFEQRNEIYYFVWNSNNTHAIFAYNFLTNTAKNIFGSSVLNFISTDYIVADAIIDANNDILLAFTNSRNEPFLINVSKLQRNGYPRFTNLTPDEEILRYITLAKQPPLFAPTFEFGIDSNREQNMVVGNVFQFAAQYVYEDGHISAISPYSKAAYSVNSVLYDRISAPTTAPLNKIDVYVPHIKADVSKIKFLARTSNSGTFFEIGEAVNIPNSNGNASIAFYNDKTFGFVSANEENKLFDAVPTDVSALVISNNRLFTANYSEGFPNIDVSGIEVYSMRKKTSTSTSFTAKNLRTNFNTESTNAKGFARYLVSAQSTPANVGSSNFASRLGVQFNISEIPDIVSSGTFISLDFTVNYGLILYDRTGVSPIPTVAPPFTITYADSGIGTRTYDLNNKNSGGFDFARSLRLYGKPIIVKRSIFIDSQKTKQEVIDLIRTELTKSNTIQITPDLSNEAHSVLAAHTSSAADYRFWFGGTIQTVFEPSSDYINGNLISFNLKITGGNIRAVKAINNNDKGVRAIKTSSQIPSNYIGGFNNASRIVSNYIFYNNEVSFSGNTAININGVSHFKSNANHNFGVVYKDNRGRRSFVMPIKDVKSEGNIFPNGDARSFDFIIPHTPPDYASTYSIVYAGNDKYDYYEQYSVAEAFAGNGDGQEFDSIYVAMRHLEGKPNSYIDSKYPNIDYKFVKGDRLRILGYKNGNTTTTPFSSEDGVEFEITDYKFFDESDTPITPLSKSSIEQGEYRSTGWFLVLRNKDFNKWSAKAILDEEDFWKNDVIVEIYRDKKEAQELVYREIGLELPIKTLEGGKRIHGGNKRDLSDAPITTSVIIEGSQANGWSISTDIEVFSGETLTFTADGNNFVLTVVSATRISDDFFNVEFTPPIQGDDIINQAAIANVPIGNIRTVVRAENGDSYLRPRLIKLNPTFDPTLALFINQTVYNALIIEAQSLNDFFESSVFSYGKPNTVNKEAKRITRSTSVTWSDAFTLDGKRQNISSFNNSLANWMDYSVLYGGISYIMDTGDGLLLMQERKCSIVGVNRSIVEYTDGDSNLGLSKNVLSDTPRYFSGSYGVNNNIESISKDRDGRIFFVDVRHRKPCRISQNGVQPIDKDMGSYFNTVLAAYNERPLRYKIYGAIDTEADEYIISIQDFLTGAFNVYETPIESLEDLPEPDYTFEVPLTENEAFALPYIVDDSRMPTIENETRPPDEICENIEDSILGILYIDNIDNDPYVYLSTQAIDNYNSLVPIIITNLERDFHVYATYNLTSQAIVPEAEPTCFWWYGTINPVLASLRSGDTIAYSVSDNAWTTRYSFKPQMMACVNDKLFSWSGATMWIHDQQATRCNYYGTQYSWKVNSVYNYDPSKVKFYRALSIEGNAKPSVYLYNEDQNTIVYTNFWETKERNQYSHIPRTITANSWTNYIFVGAFKELKTLWILEFGFWNDNGIWSDTTVWQDTPQAGQGLTSLIFKNDIRNTPIPKGSELLRVPAAVYQAAQTDPNANVTFTPISTNVLAGNVYTNNALAIASGNGSVFQDGDLIFIRKNAAVDGDVLRGTWLGAEYTFSETTPIEIRAFNSIYVTSMLHNELGEQFRQEPQEE